MLNPKDIDIIVLSLKHTKESLQKEEEIDLEIIKDIDRIIKDFGYDLD